MLRKRLNEGLKEAMKARNLRQVSTIRLILAALKDRDIAARGRGVTEGIEDVEILTMLRTMIKQRREAIGLYEQGGRLELAEQEGEEITIIESFMPRQLDDLETREAVLGVIAELGSKCLRDIGKIMAELRQRYGDRMDFAKASGIVKQSLA
ncbi:Aspartyl-tRNA amidotransferase subunit B [uncultured Gammaproteobacteria bacterium]